MSHAAFRPTMRLAAAAIHHAAAAAPVIRPLPRRIVPGLVVAGSVSAVALYVRHCLSAESAIMDARFRQQNTPESEASRRRALHLDTNPDPRHSIFNVLSWSK